MRVLLIGATGFLGAHIHAALMADGTVTEIVGAGLALPSASEVMAGGPATSWLALDLAAMGSQDIDHLVADVAPDAVINAAGRTAGTPEELHALNTVFVAHLIGALGRRAPTARLVHLGSAAEYGPTRAGRPTSEHDPVAPVGPYGETKLAGTQLVQGAGRDGLRTVVLRVFNPVGAGMDPRTLPGNAARRLAKAMATGDRVVHLGPLGAHRDFVAAADVATAAVAGMHRAAASGQILNVGTGRALSARALVHSLAEVAGWSGGIEEADEGSARSAAVSWMAADISLARRLLGWCPQVPITEALRDLWETTRAAMDRSSAIGEHGAIDAVTSTGMP